MEAVKRSKSIDHISEMNALGQFREHFEGEYCGQLDSEERCIFVNLFSDHFNLRKALSKQHFSQPFCYFFAGYTFYTTFIANRTSSVSMLFFFF